jgi:hypothetical protein
LTFGANDVEIEPVAALNARMWLRVNVPVGVVPAAAVTEVNEPPT